MSEISASKVFFSSFAVFSRSSAFIRFTLVTVSAQSSSSSLKPSVVPERGPRALLLLRPSRGPGRRLLLFARGSDDAQVGEAALSDSSS